MNEAFERISQGLKEAIAHASGEEVEGVIIHQPKKAQIVRKETHTKKYVSQNHNNVYDSVIARKLGCRKKAQLKSPSAPPFQRGETCLNPLFKGGRRRRGDLKGFNQNKNPSGV